MFLHGLIVDLFLSLIILSPPSLPPSSPSLPCSSVFCDMSLLVCVCVCVVLPKLLQYAIKAVWLSLNLVLVTLFYTKKPSYILMQVRMFKSSQPNGSEVYGGSSFPDHSEYSAFLFHIFIVLYRPRKLIFAMFEYTMSGIFKNTF